MSAELYQPESTPDAAALMIAVEALQAAFPQRIRRDVPLAPFTATRICGPCDVFLEVGDQQELAFAAELLWETGAPFKVLGGGSNVLVSDRGYRGVILLNRARAVRFDEASAPPYVWAESGANLGRIARQAAARGLSGLEWAAGIPGTIGGAVVGNAGAHGDDTAACLILAEILHPGNRRQEYTPEQLEFAYRRSALKAEQMGQPDGQIPSPGAIVLTASLRLEPSTSEQVQARIDEFVEYRRRTQPPGASMGSMFKNPPGDYAGRLIEAAGLKGARQGSAQISPLHANFFINLGGAGADDVYRLIRMARSAVLEHSGVELELEIELIGDWND